MNRWNSKNYPDNAKEVNSTMFKLKMLILNGDMQKISLKSKEKWKKDIYFLFSHIKMKPISD